MARAARTPAWMALACAALALGFIACKSSGPGADAPPDRSVTPTVSEIAASWNARVARLDRFWARTVVTMRYLDADGDEKSAQGEGHLQRLDWYNVAVSVGKLGETYFWFGADRDRYWFFDLSESDRRRVVYGRHDELTRAKGQLLSIPVPPRQYMRFAGLSAFPTRIDGASVKRIARDRLEVSFTDRAGDWIYIIDERTFYPISITSIDDNGDPEVRSELSDYRTVRIENPGSSIIQAPGRIVIEHVPSATSITITIDGQMIDGRRANKPKPGAFDFEALFDAFGPIDEALALDEIDDLETLEMLIAPEEDR